MAKKAHLRLFVKALFLNTIIQRTHSWSCGVKHHKSSSHPLFQRCQQHASINERIKQRKLLFHSFMGTHDNTDFNENDVQSDDYNTKPTNEEAKPNNHKNSFQQSPHHLAFILDGNGRWAHKYNFPVSVGHSKGAARVISTLKYLQKETNVECCTLYAFSTENWTRSNSEIHQIWNVIEQTAVSFTQLAIKEGMQFKILGDLNDDRIPNTLVQKLKNLEKDTASSTSSSSTSEKIKYKRREKLVVALAINYGGRQDIISAAQRIIDNSLRVPMSDENNGNNDSHNRPHIKVNEEMISSNLSTADLPPLDMVIRTGGDQRMSNFLLWDAAYAELYFTDTLWPDFDEDCLIESLKWFSNRDRRFGGRKEEKSTRILNHGE